MDIYQQLEELGLKKKPAAAYLALLRLQKANAHQIAKEAGIERTTIYNIMEELVEKQLATKSLNGTRLTYLAESPTRFQHLILKQSGILKELLPVLETMVTKGDFKPIIKYYETRNGIGKALMDSLKDSREKLCRDLASVRRVVELMGDPFINRYIAERVKQGIKLRSLRPAALRNQKIDNWYARDENKDVLREVRYLNADIHIDVFIKIYDDTLLLISSKKEMFAVMIRSPELAQALKALYDIAWAGAQKV
jgi:sugar-specific transcriptional regulator TrmB